MKLALRVILCVAFCAVPISSVNNKLKEVFAWKFVDYAWEKPEDRDAAIASGEFVPANNLPLGLEVWKDKLFITIPRWKDGVVATLNYIKIDDGEETTPMPTPETTDVTTPPDGPTTPEVTTSTPPTTPEFTTPTPPDDPTTPEVTTLTTTPTTPSYTDYDDENTPLPTANILPMPARSLIPRDTKQQYLEILERPRRALGEVENESDVNSFIRKSSSSSKKDSKSKKKDKNNKKEDEEDDKKKKDKDTQKDKKDKKKNKKKKKCKPKPKPKPTTVPPPPPSPTDVTPPTETTADVTATETTPPPPPPPRSPALIPYPSFEANKVSADNANDSKPIVSVFRVWADTCDRLWVMDTGVADILGKTEVISKPRILIYNLNNDELIKSYEFKDSDSEEHSFFANIIVDADPNNCDKAFAYVPDLGGYGIVSYDLAGDKSRRIKHNYFHFDPLAGNMEVGGVNFQWTDGVFSIALGKPMDDGFRTAYFHCLASTKEFSVNTKVLKSEDSSNDSFYDYKLIGDRGEKSQSSASYIHEDTGIMFYTQLQKDSVNCWNTNKPLKPENLAEVASDNETMIFTNDLKVDREGNLWVLTDKLPVFIYRGLDDSEVNYRIFTATVEEAVAGTSCAP